MTGIEDIILNAAITGLSIFLGSYVMLQITVKKLKKDIKKEAIAYLNTHECQEIIYKIGGLIGTGAKQGIGLNIPKGKGGLEGLVMQLFGGWAEKQFGIGKPETQDLNKQTSSMNIE